MQGFCIIGQCISQANQLDSFRCASQAIGGLGYIDLLIFLIYSKLAFESINVQSYLIVPVHQLYLHLFYPPFRSICTMYVHFTVIIREPLDCFKHMSTEIEQSQKCLERGRVREQDSVFVALKTLTTFLKLQLSNHETPSPSLK